MGQILRAAGYVKLAKLWQKNKDAATALHHSYFEKRCTSDQTLNLVRVFIDITGNKHIYGRKQMVLLLSACMKGQVDLIITPSRAYLAPNCEEFCYLLKFLSELPDRIDIVSDDDDYRIDTVLDVEDQRKCLFEMAQRYIGLNQADYEEWKQRLMKAIKDNEEI